MLKKRRIKCLYVIFILIIYLILLFVLTTTAVGVVEGDNTVNEDTGNNFISNEELFVIVPHANIRSEPSGSSSKIGFAKLGDKLIKLGEKGNWYNIQLEGDKEGWIYKTLVKEGIIIDKESEKDLQSETQVVEKKSKSLFIDELIVIASYANIRNEPSTSSSKIASAKEGDRLLKLEEKDNWYKIELENNKTGWIFKKLVKEQKTISRNLVKDLYPEIESIMGNYDYKKSQDSYFKAKGWYPSFQFINCDKDIEVENLEDGYSVLVNVYQDKKDIETKTFQDEINYLYLSNADKLFFQMIISEVFDEDPKINKAGINLWFAQLNVLGELEWEKVGTIVKRRVFAEEKSLIELPIDEFWKILDENTIRKDLWK